MILSPRAPRSESRLSDLTSAMPNMSLSDLSVPDLHMPDLHLRDIQLPDVDVRKSVTAAATDLGLLRAAPRRWPIVLVGAMTLGVATWLVINRDLVRARVDGIVRSVADRVGDDGDGADAVAFPAAETAEIRTPAFANGTGASYPEGLGGESDESSGVRTEELATAQG